MTIAIVGLGLIGGSLAKALSASGYTVLGADLDDGVQQSAVADRAISDVLTDVTLREADILVAALYPEAAVKYVLQKLPLVKRGAITVDLCGVKRSIHRALDEPCRERGVHFVGGHPMAGRERSGYEASSAELFVGASMIFTTPDGKITPHTDMLSEVFSSAGFGGCVVTTPERHDMLIACTSQLAHVVSSAYVKSPTAEGFDGFSAGSFRDLTRVARLNEHMWSELFLANPDYLTDEIDCIIDRLDEYRRAIRSGDQTELKRLLKEGSDIKKRLESE